jgi:hypothetical protein
MESRTCWSVSTRASARPLNCAPAARDATAKATSASASRSGTSKCEMDRARRMFVEPGECAEQCSMDAEVENPPPRPECCREIWCNRAAERRSAGGGTVTRGVSERRRSRAHVAYQTADSGGGTSGTRETAAGSAGCPCATAGSGIRRVEKCPCTGDAAWHDPHPQANPRCDELPSTR